MEQNAKTKSKPTAAETPVKNEAPKMDQKSRVQQPASDARQKQQQQQQQQQKPRAAAPLAIVDLNLPHGMTPTARQLPAHVKDLTQKYQSKIASASTIPSSSTESGIVDSRSNRINKTPSPSLKSDSQSYYKISLASGSSVIGGSFARLKELYVTSSFSINKCCSLIPDDGILFNEVSRAPPPSKDYCQILVRKNRIFFRTWFIHLRQDVHSFYPRETRMTYIDFVADPDFQDEIGRIFGEEVLQHIKRLCTGHLDYLPRLPSKLLVKIFSNLSPDDIGNLALSCKTLNTVTKSNDLWEALYRRYCSCDVTKDLVSFANVVGWRDIFEKNKLHLKDRELKK